LYLQFQKGNCLFYIIKFFNDRYCTFILQNWPKKTISAYTWNT